MLYNEPSVSNKTSSMVRGLNVQYPFDPGPKCPVTEMRDPFVLGPIGGAQLSCSEANILGVCNDVIVIAVIIIIVVIRSCRCRHPLICLGVAKVEAPLLSCGGYDVIIIDSARQGRMSVGRCLTSSHRLNCSADVTLYLEHKCAGRRQCSVSFDSVLDNTPHGCHQDLKTYLEILYSCIPVETPRTTCPGNAYVFKPTEPSGYLARVATIETGIGSGSCPWVIEVKSGQTLALTLLDFGIWRLANQSGDGRSMCRIYMTVKDRLGSGSPLRICGGTRVEERRHESFFTSVTNSVEIVMNPGDDQFVVKYEVLGCPDLSPTPPHSSVERNGNRLTIRCDKGNEGGGGGGGGGELGPIVLTCVDGNWTGPALVNCSTALDNKPRPEKGSWFGDVEIHREWLIAVISVTVTLIVSCLLFVLFARLYKEYLLRDYLGKEKERMRAARCVLIHKTIPYENVLIINDSSPSPPPPHVDEIQSTYLTMTTANVPQCNEFISSDMGIYEEPMDDEQPENTDSSLYYNETQKTNQYMGLDEQTTAEYLALYTDLRQREESENYILPEDTVSNHHGDD